MLHLIVCCWVCVCVCLNKMLLWLCFCNRTISTIRGYFNHTSIHFYQFDLDCCIAVPSLLHIYNIFVIYPFYVYIKFEVSLNNFPGLVSDSLLPEGFVHALFFPTVNAPLLRQLGLPSWTLCFPSQLSACALVSASLVHLPGASRQPDTCLLPWKIP